jgi:hypothetical protein
MQYRSLLSSLSKFGGLGQSNHFGAVLALSSSLVLAACGGGNGNSVTENNLSDPAGTDGVAPTLTTVTLTTVESGLQFAKLGETVKISFTASESLMTPSVTINGEEAEVNGGNKSWSATRQMGELETDGMVEFSIAFGDISGETGTAVSASTMASNEDGVVGSWASVEYCADGGCVVAPVVEKTINFEGAPTLAWRDIGTATGDVDPGTSTLVPDPDNAENTVASSTVYAGSKFYGGAYLIVGSKESPDLTVNLSALDPVISVRVRPSSAGKEVRLKLEQADNNQVFVEAKTYTSVEGEWETLYFDFSDPASGAIDPAVSYGAFFMIYDFAKNNPAADQSWYWDDITHGGVVSGGPVAPPEPPSEFAVWGAFGGATNQDDVYTFPSGQEPWAGWGNSNDSLYPYSFPDGGKITFTAALVAGGADTNVKFVFESNPHPDNAVTFATDLVNVTGETETTYTVEFGPQAADQEWNSLLMYLVEMDSSVIIKDVKVSAVTATAATWGEFGGMAVDGDSYTFPTGAEGWGGFANNNAGLYPFNFPFGGSITFTAAVAAGGTDTNVRFLFEADPHPNNNPNFTTTNVTVSGETETTYKVEFGAQAADQDWNSFIMYIVERDQAVIVKNVEVTASEDTSVSLGEFGGMAVDGDTYTFPTGAEGWGGFANTNAALYPYNFPYGGSITFTAAVAAGGTDTNVRFLFEADPHPNNNPNFTTTNVTVSGETETSYTVEFGAQAADQDWNSLIMYIVERDQAVIVKDIQVTASENTAVSLGEFGGMAVDGDSYTFPTGAEGWGGFANTNSELYPFRFANGGSITFTAAVAAGGVDTNVRFLFEADPHPNNNPNFTTTNVTVSGETETSYTVEFGAQAADQDWNSLIMYIVERDQAVTVKNIQVTTN